MTVCSRCGREKYPVYFLPTVASKASGKLKDAVPVCEGCLTPAERFRLVELPEINRRLRVGKRNPTVISEREYNRLFSWADWKCPYGVREPRNCNGSPCYVEEFDRCVESLKARMIIEKVWRGEILVK